ncbi:MAG: hypothetical protein CM15mV139_020 [Caudoviricetes sp.]|nr:MAG: hypothetical protein CM15mV139_020 [Caudoviricetes sp.]
MDCTPFRPSLSLPDPNIPENETIPTAARIPQLSATTISSSTIEKPF